jgi:hypothetical protein
MGRPTARDIDLGFEQVVTLRRFERDWDALRTREFWQRLNPELTISDRPLAAPLAARPPIAAAVAARAREQLDALGFFATPPVLTAAECAVLRTAVARLAEAGLPSGCLAVYDEVYRCFAGLEPLFEPVLGADYLWVADGLWAFYVPAGAPARNGLWSPFDAHRDSLGPDPAVVGGGRPSILTVWIPLSDVTPAESCLYVVPKPGDPGFRAGEQGVGAGDFDLQSIRAIPAAAGSVVAWSTHLIHWGSRSWADAASARVAVTTYFQRADVPPFDPSVFDPAGEVSLDSRLRWILASMGVGSLADRLRWD